jgi:hypothetical protein
MIMDSFNYRSNVFVEVIEIGNKFDKAKIDKSIFTPNNTTINFLLARS